MQAFYSIHLGFQFSRILLYIHHPGALLKARHIGWDGHVLCTSYLLPST